MGLKDKFMGNMMSNMSTEEKGEMMNNMMEKFFDGMTEDEKSSMMSDMMSNMMGGDDNPMMKMMGGGSSMMEMCRKMNFCGNNEEAPGEGGTSMMDMCMKMMTNNTRSSEIASFATPEVRALFEEWAQQVDEEIMDFIKDKNTVDPAKVAEHLKISQESAVYFLTKLAQKEKIKIKFEQ